MTPRDMSLPLLAMKDESTVAHSMSIRCLHLCSVTTANGVVATQASIPAICMHGVVEMCGRN